MRLAGVDTLTIGLTLSAFPEHHAAAGTAPLEYGYGWFTRSRGGPVLSERALLDAVSKDVQRSLADSRDSLAASVDRHRELHLARLERLLAGSWARAVRGDHQAVASCLRILDREARLLGYATGPRALPGGEDEEEMIGAAMDALDVTLREISRRRPDVLPGEIEP